MTQLGAKPFKLRVDKASPPGAWIAGQNNSSMQRIEGLGESIGLMLAGEVARGVIVFGRRRFRNSATASASGSACRNLR
jgi:hypothetical protein